MDRTIADMDKVIEQFLGNSGAAGIVALALAYLWRTFVIHYETEIQYLRARVDRLEEKLIRELPQKEG